MKGQSIALSPDKMVGLGRHVVMVDKPGLAFLFIKVAVQPSGLNNSYKAILALF